ncbi:hypothetical protein SAMN05216428_101103 [Nitrosospira sp. Nsp11]|uniref:hypothetical protein n=1 Tax=Nitrosospira sp. Nsp11 TaxID=1855338 RepID=UPI0009115275|nr:hypothetical protein [Nitrosospira sp. Nsp11]SHL10973.1 hypothetical protein SAMN05216428_101103 [Nitrosospira sp. Nsp11]
MTTPVNRKEHKDIPKNILLTWDLLKWVEARSDELDVSHSAYVRSLIAADQQRVQNELLQAEADLNSPNPAQILNSLASLLTKHPELVRLLEKLLTGQK